MNKNKSEYDVKEYNRQMRRIAEKNLQGKEQKMSEKIKTMNTEDIKNTIHELEVHQIQLEMQNEELKRVHRELDISRSKYFDLYDLAPVGYLTLDRKGVIVDGNLMACKLLGTDRNDLLGTPFTRFIMRDDQDIFYHYKKNIGKTQKHEESELRMLRKGEKPFWSNLSTMLDKDEDGNPYYRVVISDISRRKEVEMELEEAKKQAVDANEAKSQFLANMSHEIRTPINGLMIMAHLLEMTELNEEQLGFLEHINKSSDSLLKVIDNILDYSKIEAGEMELERVQFQPDKVLEEVTKVFRVKVSRKDLEMKISTGDDIPTVTGDPFRFRQVLANLISNAVKYTKNGEIEISLNKTKDSDSDKIKFECSVRDTGIGIHPEKIDLMFERFCQADTSNTRQYGGTGLGLAICKGLVEKMEGEIWAESTPGEGSCFTFTFITEPATEDDSASSGEMIETTEMQEEIHLLLVEDDPISRRLIKEICKSKGWNIMMATNGREAVEMFKENSFDAVIMDIQLPIFDGLMATEMIREWEVMNGTYTPVIGVTAYANDGMREKCLNAGMDEYLSKPVKPKTFELVVAKMTDRLHRL